MRALSTCSSTTSDTQKQRPALTSPPIHPPPPRPPKSTLSSTPSRSIELTRKTSAGVLTVTSIVNAPRPSSYKSPAPRRPSSTTPAAARIPPPPASRIAAPVPSARVALRPRDSNVGITSRALRPAKHQLPPSPLARFTATPNMPFDKPSTTNPRQPQLAARAKTAPLTPKVASGKVLSPQQHTVTISTPLPRRTQRPESVISLASNARDDNVASPVQAFLNNNITPRSGSRQSRVDTQSPGSTPGGTPNPDKHDTWETRSGLGIDAGFGFSQPVMSFSDHAARQDPDSKFFYASEAPKSQPVQQQQRPLAQPLQHQASRSQSTFFYANGNSAVPDRQNPVAPAGFMPPVTPPASSQDSLMSKFVYANGTPDLPPPRPAFGSPSPGSTISTASKLPPAMIPRLGGTASPNGFGAVQRPASPVKYASYPVLASGSTSATPKAPAAPSRTNTGITSVPTPSTTSQSNVNSTTTSRRTSVEAHGPLSRHVARSGSLSIADPPAVARLLSEHTVSGTSPLLTSEVTSPVATSYPSSAIDLETPGLPSFLAGSGTEDLVASPTDDTGPDSLQSPTRSVSQDQALSELVASARRERKVQDLEITNASLEAINRTLERQLRRQTAELRRYRRLSRSGRLSLASAGARSRVSSDGSAAEHGGLARAGLELEDLSEEAESDEEEEDEEDDFDDDLDEEDGDDSARHGARHRRRQQDEARLRLDLSRHQQLLIDSQKMNQSLKRCLGWTEELIRDGRRALEYRVRVSEVAVGGRVLQPEELEEHGVEEDLHDAEVAVEEDTTLHAVPLELEGVSADVLWSKEPQDRDSGIELPADGV